MPEIDDGKDEYYAAQRQPDRFYVSKRFTEGGDAPGEVGQPARFAYQVFDSKGDIAFESDRAWDVVLRETPTRQQLKALFLEDGRRIARMAFQRFDADGKKMKSDYFVLHGKEVLDLAAFLALVVSPTDGLLEGDDGTRLTSAVIAGLLMDQSTERELYEKNKAELLELLKSDVSAPEVVALARRRREVEVFQELLNDGAAFASRLAKMSETKEKRPEDVWQDFFERNQWIFGSGLTTQFLHSWSADALSQTVVGSSVKRVGKRPDALMSTAGALSALVFVEIKTHATKLLAAEEYRGDAFRPGGKLVGAVAQCQATMDAAIEELGTELRKKDS